MLSQTKQLDNLLECHRVLTKQSGKLEQLDVEMKQILAEIKSILEAIQDFMNSLNNKMKDEFDQLADAIQRKTKTLSGDLNQQNDRLDSFELRITDIQISDSDQFFLTKEINKYKDMLDQIKFPKDTLLDNMEEIQNQLEIRPNQQVTSDELDVAKMGLKLIEKFE